MTSISALLLLAVSYGRDIAPIFALHCNSCHGDSGTAGGLETRTRAGLMNAVVPGEPDRSRIIELVEGRRGEEHRMPLGGVPLTAQQIALIGRWIAEGAVADAEIPPSYKFGIPKIRIRGSKPLRIECRVPVQAYLILTVRGFGRVLYERRATVKAPRDRGDSAAPGEPVTWTIHPEKGWPSTVAIELSVLYAGTEPRGVTLRAVAGMV